MAKLSPVLILANWVIDDVITQDDGTVVLHMPPVEIFVTTLDNSRTQVYDRKTGVVGLNTQLETSARQEAERLILQSALEDGLEWKAEENARSVMRSFMVGLGFENVVFVDVMPTLTPEPTATAGIVNERLKGGIMRIKHKPSDFKVEERILFPGDQGSYAYYKVEKHGTSTTAVRDQWQTS